jgi:cytoskeletal protein RodZ
VCLDKPTHAEMGERLRSAREQQGLSTQKAHEQLAKRLD